MESEFDREIDVLLRHAKRRADSAPEIAVSHLDADEINAFAEHALSGKAQARAVEHLADCSRCRNILSNLLLFNAEPESEIVHAKETPILVAPPIPWYQKLFAFPQIAYAMGVLLLVLGGMIAVIVLKDASRNASSDIAQMDDKIETQSPFSESSAGNANINYSLPNSANTSANSAAMANSSAPAATPKPENKTVQNTNSAQIQSPETNNKDTQLPKSASKPSPLAEESEFAKKEKSVAAAPPPAARANDDKEEVAADSVVRQQPEPSQNSAVQNQTMNQTMMPDTRNSPTQRANRRAESGGTVLPMENRSLSRVSEIKNVGGKNFRRSGGVWYDVDYKNQKTIDLRRSSDEYKKLDAGVRSIADKLGGVVVIVSGAKAYRIQ